MEKSKKLTIEELRTAQDLQAELFGLLSSKVGDNTDWTVFLSLKNVSACDGEYVTIDVIIDDKVFSAILTEWAGNLTPDNLKANLTAYINENYQ